MNNDTIGGLEWCDICKKHEPVGHGHAGRMANRLAVHQIGDRFRRSDMKPPTPFMLKGETYSDYCTRFHKERRKYEGYCYQKFMDNEKKLLEIFTEDEYQTLRCNLARRE